MVWAPRGKIPMRRLGSQLMLTVCLLLGSAGLAAGEDAAQQQGKSVGVAVLDFNYVDTSGETRDMSADHQKWLAAPAAGLRTDFDRGGFRVVSPVCNPAPCALGSTPPEQLMSAAKDAGAALLVTGAVHKESTLIQWAKVLAVNVDDNRVVLDKLVTFRGDSDEAWARAEEFIARDLLGLIRDKFLAR
jgi:hypothetical protein